METRKTELHEQNNEAEIEHYPISSEWASMLLELKSNNLLSDELNTLITKYPQEMYHIIKWVIRLHQNNLWSPELQAWLFQYSENKEILARMVRDIEFLSCVNPLLTNITDEVQLLKQSIKSKTSIIFELVLLDPIPWTPFLLQVLIECPEYAHEIVRAFEKLTELEVHNPNFLIEGKTDKNTLLKKYPSQCEHISAGLTDLNSAQLNAEEYQMLVIKHATMGRSPQALVQGLSYLNVVCQGKYLDKYKALLSEYPEQAYKLAKLLVEMENYDLVTDENLHKLIRYRELKNLDLIFTFYPLIELRMGNVLQQIIDCLINVEKNDEWEIKKSFLLGKCRNTADTYKFFKSSIYDSRLAQKIFDYCQTSVLSHNEKEVIVTAALHDLKEAKLSDYAECITMNPKHALFMAKHLIALSPLGEEEQKSLRNHPEQAYVVVTQILQNANPRRPEKRF